MKLDHPTVQTYDCSVPPEEATTCDDCGRVGAYRRGDHALCLDGHPNRGAGCREFGRDDLWTFPNEDRSACAGVMRT